MSQLDDVISKIPKPILVFVVLFFALIFIIQQNPLSDGCVVELENFRLNTKGILTAYRDKDKRLNYPQIGAYKKLCVTGNSQGSCADYFKALKSVADILKKTPDKCYPMMTENMSSLIPTLQDGLKVMALVAWSDRPPESISQRLGWFTESDIYGFCRAKNLLTKLISNEDYLAFRASVYLEFPDNWSESLPLEKRAEMPRPRALKSSANPAGSLSPQEVYERSLFSLRCDLYQ